MTAPPRRLIHVVGAVAEALGRGLPVVDDVEDERRDFQRQEQDLAGEADGFSERGLACPCEASHGEAAAEGR